MDFHNVKFLIHCPLLILDLKLKVRGVIIVKKENEYADLIQLAKHVLLNYNIKPDKLEIIQNDKEKKLWKFSNNNKTMCLKTLRQTKNKVIFTVNAQIYIFNKGGNVPEVYLNSEGNPITEYMDKLFVLYEWIDSRPLDFNKPLDLCLGLEGIAKFHKFSKGYTPPKNAGTSSKLGRWSEQYKSMKNRMLKWKESAQNSLPNPSYSSYLNNIDFIIEMCNKALIDLKKSSYHVLTSIQIEESSLCHQDYGTGNALVSDNGVYVIDLDGVTYDLPLRDLRKIIVKRMEVNGKWEKDILDRILNWYEKYNPLSLKEKELLKIDLLFPHCFFGRTKNIFKKNKLESVDKICKVTELEKSKIHVLEEWY